MFRCLATSSSSSLSQTHVKVQNSFASVMVPGQLIYFHLDISQTLLIYLDHLKISRHPAKKTLGVLLCTRVSEESQSQLWRVGGGGGEVMCPREWENQSHRAFSQNLPGRSYLFLWPNLVQASPLLPWIIASVETGYAPGSFTAGSVSLPWHLFIP